MEKIVLNNVNILSSSGNFLKCYRSIAGKTQKQFADAVGLSTSKYARYERGEDAINLEELKRVLDTLGLRGQLLVSSNNPEADKKA